MVHRGERDHLNEPVVFSYQQEVLPVCRHQTSSLTVSANATWTSFIFKSIYFTTTEYYDIISSLFHLLFSVSVLSWRNWNKTHLLLESPKVERVKQPADG